MPRSRSPTMVEAPNETGMPHWCGLGVEAYDGCMMGQLKLERLGRGGALKRIQETTAEMRSARVRALLGDGEDTSLVDDEREEPGS